MAQETRRGIARSQPSGARLRLAVPNILCWTIAVSIGAIFPDPTGGRTPNLLALFCHRILSLVGVNSQGLRRRLLAERGGGTESCNPQLWEAEDRQVETVLDEAVACRRLRLVNPAMQFYLSMMSFCSYPKAMGHFGKLIPFCSTAVSILALLVGVSLVALNESGARTSLSPIADQLIASLNEKMIGNLIAINQHKFPKGSTAQSLRRKAITASVELNTGAIAPIPRVSNKKEGPTSQSDPASVPALIDPLVWLFDEPSTSPVLILSRGDKGVRVTGLLITGRNASDQPLTAVSGKIKPDLTRSYIDLSLGLEGGDRSDPSSSTIPPGAAFSLRCTLLEPPEGLPANSFLVTFGGVIFTLHYTYAGAQRSFISYFSQSRLEVELQKIEETPSRPRAISQR